MWSVYSVVDSRCCSTRCLLNPLPLPAILDCMPVQIHPTPNPNAHKYTADGLKFAGPLNASNTEEANKHPLAARLFALEDVYNVFLAQDFVTVNKVAGAGWERVDGAVVAIIKDFLEK